jgi:lipoprotein-releasing system ATP-binding protein
MMLEASGSASAPPVVLAAHRVCRTLGEHIRQNVLYEIDFEARRGDFVALTGPSGSGKSTLLYLLGILDQPTSGRVVVDGVDACNLDDDERAHLRNIKLGFVFQFHFLLPEFSVLENVAIPMLKRGVARKEALARSTQTLAALGLAELTSRFPRELSGGQQQRVSIARAVAGAPPILLADEPTGNLDSKNAEDVFQMFEQLNRHQNVTVVMVTHDPDFAGRAQRLVALKDGRIVSDDRGGESPAL